MPALCSAAPHGFAERSSDSPAVQARPAGGADTKFTRPAGGPPSPRRPATVLDPAVDCSPAERAEDPTAAARRPAPKRQRARREADGGGQLIVARVLEEVGAGAVLEPLEYVRDLRRGREDTRLVPGLEAGICESASRPDAGHGQVGAQRRTGEASARVDGAGAIGGFSHHAEPGLNLRVDAQDHLCSTPAPTKSSAGRAMIAP